jgi:HSP20 family protein
MLSHYGAAGRWFDPTRQMHQAQQDMNRLLGSLRLPAPPEFPLMNVWTSAEGAVITAEIPGVVPEELDIAVHQNTVALRGNRAPEQLPEGAIVHRQERVTGTFARNVMLPFRVDGDRAAARFSLGVLRLELPRPAADKPHKITVSRA